LLVVCDTSPIRALHVLGLLRILPVLFEEVLLAPAVVAELAVEVPGIGAVDCSKWEFLRVASPKSVDAVRESFAGLGSGECQALALAVERHADFVLIDDGEARAAAKRLNLVPLGVLGTLVRAKDVGLVPTVAPLIDRLVEEIGFRVSPQVRRDVLDLANE
jgi:predicted nucleic acid-binding protein